MELRPPNSPSIAPLLYLAESCLFPLYPRKTICFRRYTVLDSREAREIRIRKEWSDKSRWMVNWVGPGPGERSTELVLAQDKGFVEKDNSQYGSGRCLEET